MNTETLSPEPEAPVWGLAGTLLWGLFIFFIFSLTQVFALGIYVGFNYPNATPEEHQALMETLQTNGVALSICSIVGLIVGGAAIVGVVKFKKHSNLKQYLGLTSFTLSDSKNWGLLVLGAIALSDLLTYALGKPIVPEFMVNVYGSTDQKWLLWIALIVAAPVLEELFFRGFVISGLRRTVLGTSGAILLSSVAWAALHIQYDLYGIATIIVFGIILGVTRIKTGSVLLTIALHALMNLIATIETSIYIS